MKEEEQDSPPPPILKEMRESLDGKGFHVEPLSVDPMVVTWPELLTVFVNVRNKYDGRNPGHPMLRLLQAEIQSLVDSKELTSGRSDPAVEAGEQRGK